jgi:hypothetical protein
MLNLIFRCIKVVFQMWAVNKLATVIEVNVLHLGSPFRFISDKKMWGKTRWTVFGCASMLFNCLLCKTEFLLFYFDHSFLKYFVYLYLIKAFLVALRCYLIAYYVKRNFSFFIFITLFSIHYLVYNYEFGDLYEDFSSTYTLSISLFKFYYKDIKFILRYFYNSTQVILTTVCDCV